MKDPKIIILKRELGAYFTSPIAYIVTGLFTVFSSFLFFAIFFIQNRAELRQFFTSLPMLFAFFIPALTMRLFSEERKNNSLETLLTLPVTSFDVVIGKYLASFCFSLCMLIPSIAYIITVFLFGKPDLGPLVGGYIGAIFLAASFCAIGLFSSAVTKNQILSFFIAFAICIFLALADGFLIFLPAPIVNLLQYVSAGSHFESISKGIIDTRDLLYFVSLTAVFLTLTVKVLDTRRVG